MSGDGLVLRLDAPGNGLRVAVKDLVDMAGLPTAAGCRVLADRAEPAAADAPLLAGLRAAEAAGRARVVGRAFMNELAYGVTGLNPWWSSPPNPLDRRRVIGGSSGGSAVVVAAGAADVAIGSDTGGSVRIPAACCGVAGLKTTAGRIPLAGVWPLAPSLDTVGPLARDVAGVAAGMALLEPGFTPAAAPARRVVRFSPGADPVVEAAVDAAVAATGIPQAPVALPGWAAATVAGMAVLAAEAWAVDRELFATGGLSPEVAVRLEAGAGIGPAAVDAARATGVAWAAQAAAAVGEGEVLAMPTLAELPPTVDQAGRVTTLRLTMPWNLAGWPALSLPVPCAGGGLPASVQLVARPGGEELLVATAAVVEAAVG